VGLLIPGSGADALDMNCEHGRNRDLKSGIVTF
jgi:hypothetical protein